MEKQWKQWETLFLGGSKITADGDCSHEIKRRLLLGREVMTNLDSLLKSRDITLPTNVCPLKAMVFPVVLYGWDLNYKESWAPKNWCFELGCWRKLRCWESLGVSVKSTCGVESPLDYTEFQSVHPKGNQSWIFIGRTDAATEAEAPILWPPDGKN